MAMIGDFSVEVEQALSFSSSLAVDNLRPVCPGGALTGLLTSLCESSSVGTIAMHTFEERGIVEEVVSLLTKGAVGTFQLSQYQGGFYSHHFLATKHTGGFCPTPIFVFIT